MIDNHNRCFRLSGGTFKIEKKSCKKYDACAKSNKLSVKINKPKKYKIGYNI